jgi:hypothetical protein
MTVLTETQLLERINAFRARHDDMAPTTFGRNATGEPQLIRSIENGRSPSLSVVNRILDYMARTDAEAATRAKLDAPIDVPLREEVEQELPFVQAPGNPGATSATCSSTNARRSPSEASPRCPSCSGTDEEAPHAAVTRIPAAEGAGAGHVTPPCSGDPRGD